MSSSSGPIRVALINDYEIVLNGLARMLEPYGDRVTVVEQQAGGLPSQAADVALFDTFAGRRYSLSRIKDLADDIDIKRVVLYTWDVPDAFAMDIAEHDVDGVILKSTTGESLVAAIERVFRGEAMTDQQLGRSSGTPPLTEREREVLALIARGQTNREIADELYLSLDTVKTHVRKLFRKLDVGNRTQAAMLAVDHQLTLAD